MIDSRGRTTFSNGINCTRINSTFTCIDPDDRYGQPAYCGLVAIPGVQCGINTCTTGYTCQNGTTCVAPCTPSPEICDGRDNNCNGQVDENACFGCVDTDGGNISTTGGRAYLLNQSTGGEVSWSTKIDTCLSSLLLNEAVCVTDSSMGNTTRWNNITCSTINPVFQCRDTDGAGPTPAVCS